MAQNNTLGRNIEFPIMNSDDTPFHALVLHKATYESTIMSLGDKITGDVYYADNTLAVTMQEYIEYGGVHYVLVTPPTIVKEGIVSDNGQLNGMTKYSFTFYHPMYMLSNFPFTDVAVSSSETQYLSESKKFSWCGTGMDFIAKLNKNLENTQWVVVASGNEESLAKLALLPSDIPTSKSADTAKSNVLTFDNAFIADALKTMYDTWEVPFVIDNISEGEYFDSNNNDYYDNNKRFVIVVGLPSNEILDENEEPFVFQFGKGVGLKNNSRTPRNNKIVTRIAGIGSERNIPYGYPQVRWYGTSGAKFTYGDAAGVYTNVTIGGHTFAKVVSYPIYKGILGGQYVELIKHPFTRKTLMPSVYAATLFNKISPYLSNGSYNPNYNPDTTIIDYYDATEGTYPNPIVQDAPSYEVHQFENVYPRLNSRSIVGAQPWDADNGGSYYTYSQWYAYIYGRVSSLVSSGKSGYELSLMVTLRDVTCPYTPAAAESTEGAAIAPYSGSWDTGSCTATITVTTDENWVYAKIVSTWYNATYKILQPHGSVVSTWDDTMDDDGNYNQSYFKITLPQLDFDLYACASITEQMNIVMRSGACIGCTFEVSIDWDDYKSNFFHQDGTFDPVPHTTENDGHVRDASKYPDSSAGQIVVVVKKDLDTFGTLMPNIYQQPTSGDEFVFTGISLPESYITNAQIELDETSQQYMLENNIHYYDYPLKFDEHFLATHTNILAQIRNNTIIEFKYGNETPNKKLYVKQITVKYGDKPLPQYDITLTDDVEIVLNQIGQVTDDVSRMRVQVSELQKYYSENIIQEINNKLSRIQDDVCQGRITFQQGLDAIGSVIFHDEVRSPQFESGLYTGRGWRIDNLGNAEFESIRIRSYLEVVELLVNRLQAQEGDTLFTDNDQIDKVDPIYEQVTPEQGDDPKANKWCERTSVNNEYVYTPTNDTQVDQQKTYYYISSYILSLKEKYQGYITGQMYGNVVKGIINTLAAKQAGVSDVQDSQTVEIDGSNTYYTSWMQVIATHNTNNPDNSLGVNQIKVVLYGDDYYDKGHEGDPDHLHHITPAGKNFEPCELMTIARWGCVDYSDPQDPNYATIKASITRRQRMFMISTTEGRVVKYTGVDSPILRNGNYGVTIGELPEFVKNYPDVRAILNQVGEHTDWLYAQGVVVGKFIKVDIKGNPEPNIIDCGNWVNGANIVSPTPRNGVYLYNEWNSQTQQYETHDVWHNNSKWRCKMTQPVVSGGVVHYYEPTNANSAYWQKLASGGQDGNSVIIAGYADYYHGKDYLGNDMPKQVSETEVGQINLIAYTDPAGDMIDVGEEGESSWQSYGVPLSTCYILKGNYHLYEATENGWLDLGRFKGENGTNGASPIIADLDNEMDGVACDVGGDSDHSQTCTTTASLIQGSTKKSFTLKIREWDEDDQEYNEITQSGSILTNVVINWTNNSDNSKTITFTFGRGVTINDKREFIVVMIADNMEYKAVFTVNGVRPGSNGEPATLYNIAPSLNDIAFSRRSTGVLDPEKQYLSFTVKKTVGTNITELPSGQMYGTDKLKLTFSTQTPPSSYDSNQLWPVNTEGTVGGISFNRFGTATIPSSAQYGCIYLALFKEVTVNGSTTYVLHDRETIPVIKDGANGKNAVLQELLPSLDAISFARLADDSLTPDYRYLSLSIKKTQGGTTSTQTTSASGLTIRWALNSMPSTSSDGTQWGEDDADAAGITWNDDVMQIANNVSATNICIAAFNSSGTLVDRETIPVIKDGQHGDNAVVYEISLAGSSFSLDPNTQTIYVNIKGAVHKVVGGSRSAYSFERSQLSLYFLCVSSSGTESQDYVPNIDSLVNGYTVSGNTFATKYYDNTGFSDENVFVAVLSVDGSEKCRASIQITKDGMKGNTGGRGKVGRFFYYAGVFNSSNTTKTYLVNDAQAPYFKKNDNENTYYVFNPANPSSSSYTMAEMWAASNQSWNNAPWEIMTNDFKYLITEAIFGTYAHFGSFIINGDWLISQNGKKDGVDSNDYTKFDANFPSSPLLCNEVNVGVSYVNVCQNTFTANKTYNIRVTASNFHRSTGSAAYQLNAQMYNGASTVGSKITITSNGTSTLSFTPTSTGVYYLRCDMQNSGTFCDVSASVAGLFIPTFSVDGLTGKSYQNDLTIRGRIYSPYTRITSRNHTQYEMTDQFGDTVLDIGKSGFNIQNEYFSGNAYLPAITQDMLGCEINILNMNTSPMSVASRTQENARVVCKSSSGTDIANTNVNLAFMVVAKIKAIELPSTYSNYGQYAWVCIEKREITAG